MTELNNGLIEEDFEIHSIPGDSYGTIILCEKTNLKELEQIKQQILNNQAIVKELKNLRDFHSGKGTVPRFSHADILNELVILLKTTLHSKCSGGKPDA